MAACPEKLGHLNESRDHLRRHARSPMEALLLYRHLQNLGNRRRGNRKTTAQSTRVPLLRGGLRSQRVAFLCRCRHGTSCHPPHPRISIAFRSHRSWITHKYMDNPPVFSQGDPEVWIFREPRRTFIIQHSQNNPRLIRRQP